MNPVLRFCMQAALKPAGRRNQKLYMDDFNSSAAVYDEAATRAMLAAETEKMIHSAGLKPGMRCIDLGCGTGHASSHILKAIHPGGSLSACDFSSAMIAQTQSRIGADPAFNAVVSDMTSFLDGLVPASVDYAGAFWSMEYCDHAGVLKRISRALASGGRVSVLANISASLDELQSLVTPVIIRHPFFLRSIPPLNFLSGADECERIARRAGFRTVDMHEGALQITFHTGAELVHWMKHSGPCAGFRGALRRSRSEKLYRIISDKTDARGGITLTFRFISYLGEK